MADQKDGPSDEAKLSIGTYFLMSSPTGEINDVLNDVVKLVNDPAVLTDDAINRILQSYNTEQMVIANDPNGAPVMVTAYGQVDGNHYLDPNSGRVLAFDHRKQRFTEITEERPIPDDRANRYRFALQKALDTYLAENFKPGKALVTVYAGDNGKIIVCLSARNVNLGNFWTGSWRSTYTFNTDRSGQTELKCNLKINVHYFEDGNVQLHTSNEKAVNVNVGNEDATAAEVSKAIAKMENDFQSHLETMYVNMHTTTFKAMRRFLPVIRQNMIWSSAAHQLAQEVSK